MILKFNFSFLLILILQGPFIAQAQAIKGMLERKITFSQNSMRLDSVLKNISRQTSIPFSFNSSKLKSKKIIALKKGTQTLGDWLIYLHAHLAISHKIVGAHIILIDSRNNEQFAEKSPSAREYVKTKNKIRSKKISFKGSPTKNINSTASKKSLVKANYLKEVSSSTTSPITKADETEIFEAVGYKTSDDSTLKIVDLTTPIKNIAKDSTQISSRANGKASTEIVPAYEATAQVKNANQQKSSNGKHRRELLGIGNQLQVATEAGLVNLRQERTTLQFGTGFFVKGFYGIGRTVQLSLMGGILTFGRGGPAILRNGTLHLIPVLLGIRKLSNKFYIEPQVGYGTYKGRMVENNAYSIISVGATYWGLSTGFNFKHIDVGMRYQGALRRGDEFGGNFPTKIFNFVGLHLGYNFHLSSP